METRSQDAFCAHHLPPTFSPREQHRNLHAQQYVYNRHIPGIPFDAPMRFDNINPIIALAFIVGLFTSLWLLVLAEITRRVLFLRAANEVALATILSRHTSNRIDWNDYFLSLSFESIKGRTVYCPNHAVTANDHDEDVDVTILLYVANEPRKCLLESQQACERRMNQWLLVVAVFAIIWIILMFCWFQKALALNSASSMVSRPASNVVPVLTFACMLSVGVYGSCRILTWKSPCPYIGVEDPYYQGAILVEKNVTDYDSI
jgi:hypothetical protein